MKVLEGKSVFSGIAIGKISILQKVDASVKRVDVYKRQFLYNRDRNTENESQEE